MQFIDKLVDDPTVMQRPVSTTQAAQDDMRHIDEEVDVTALTQREVPTIPDADDPCLDETADENRLKHENIKRRLPMATEVERFEDLVLPPSQPRFDAVESWEESRDNDREGKILFVKIASGDEAEVEVEKEQAMARSLVQG